MGFNMTAGGPGGQLALVKRVWDRRQCPSLQPGDTIVKINGADVQGLSFTEVGSGSVRYRRAYRARRAVG